MTKTFNRLIEELTKLPGIGRKTAQRIAFYLLKAPGLAVEELAQAMIDLKRKVHFCPECFNLTEEERCAICSDGKRNKSLVCVVEQASDILLIERSNAFDGVYHVLGGALSPIDNIGPDELRVKELLSRLDKGKVSEVIIATNPTTEGEATAFYLAKAIKPLAIKISRIARGLPIGSDLDLADEVTIAQALEGRREIQ